MIANHVLLNGWFPELVGVPAPAGFELRGRYVAVVFAGAVLLDDRAIQSAQQGAPSLSFVSSLSLMWHTVPSGCRACTIAVRLLNISRTSLTLTLSPSHPLTLSLSLSLHLSLPLSSLSSHRRRLTHWVAAAPRWTSRCRSWPTSGAAAGIRIPRIRQQEEWPMVRSSTPKKKPLFCLGMGCTATCSPLRVTSVTCCPTRPTMQSMTGSKIFLTSLLCHRHKLGIGLGD